MGKTKMRSQREAREGGRGGGGAEELGLT